MHCVRHLQEEATNLLTYTLQNVINTIKQPFEHAINEDATKTIATYPSRPIEESMSLLLISPNFFFFLLNKVCS